MQMLTFDPAAYATHTLAINREMVRVCTDPQMVKEQEGNGPRAPCQGASRMSSRTARVQMSTRRCSLSSEMAEITENQQM